MKDSRPVAGFVVLHYLALVSTLTCVSRILRQADTGLDVMILCRSGTAKERKQENGQQQFFHSQRLHYLG